MWSRVLPAALLLASIVSAASPSSPPVFTRDIASIIFQNCSVCHRPGQVGPFSLLTYRDVRAHARQIVAVTKSGYMPPWLPARGLIQFADERHLSPEQIDLIARWVRAGAPEGSPADLPPLPKFKDGWQLGTPDLVVDASIPFTVPASGSDVFWNFTLRPLLTGTRYVRAIEIRPSSEDPSSEAARLIHHANLLVDRTGSVQRLEPAPGLGFPGMELTLERNPLDPESHFLFWKPGSKPYSEPPDMSWRLDPGNVLVLNTHLQPAGKPQSIRPSIGLYFTDQAPTEHPLLIELEHDEALRIPPGRRDFLVSDDFRLPMDVNLLAIYPHAHYLGKQLDAYATLPDGSRIWLIRIPDWNFEWQAVYRYEEAVFLPKGAIISMRFHYDNSSANPRNPNHPPKLVEAGNRAADEMGHLWLQVLPAAPGNHQRELEEALLRHRVEKNPSDFAPHLALGALLLSRLHTQEAIDELERALELNPNLPDAHDMLGSALRSLGQTRRALEEYQSALHIDSRYVDARYNLATTLARLGRISEAIPQLRQIVNEFPLSARLENELGDLLQRAGRTAEASACFARAQQLGKLGN